MTDRNHALTDETITRHPRRLPRSSGGQGMTQDKKAPERIWAWPVDVVLTCCGEWHTEESDDPTRETEYARLDLLTAAEARVEEARAVALREAARIKPDVEVRTDHWRHAALDQETAYRKAILALMDTTHAEALERVLKAVILDAQLRAFEQQRLDTPDEIKTAACAAIRARVEK